MKGKKKAIVLIGVVFAVATAGVVYAHWTDTLTVDAEISTGSTGFVFTSANTDDDGTGNGWEKTPDDGGGTLFDLWGSLSSDDPSADRATSRYDKDVARCTVTTASYPAGVVTAVVENGYPSYWCTIYGRTSVTGSVPLKQQVARVWVCESACGSFPTNYVAAPYDKASNTFWYDSSDADSDYELAMQNAPGGVCGYQYDPGDNSAWRMNLHVLQDADQGSAYTIRYQLETVNWNEYSLAACTGFKNQP